VVEPYLQQSLYLSDNISSTFESCPFRHNPQVPYRPVHHPLKRLLNLDYLDLQKQSFQKLGLVDKNTPKTLLIYTPSVRSKNVDITQELEYVTI
jgi:hypothetical protein